MYAILILLWPTIMAQKTNKSITTGLTIPGTNI